MIQKLKNAPIRGFVLKSIPTYRTTIKNAVQGNLATSGHIRASANGRGLGPGNKKPAAAHHDNRPNPNLNIPTSTRHPSIVKHRSLT